MGEINKIAGRHNSSMTPKWIHSMNYDRHAFENAMQSWPSDMTKINHSSEQRHSDANIPASSNEAIEKTSHDRFPSDEEGNTQQSSSVHPVSSKDEGWNEDGEWMVKYDMYGNVVDIRKRYEVIRI